MYHFYNNHDAIINITNHFFDIKNCNFTINDQICVTQNDTVKLLNDVVNERNSCYDKIIISIVLISIFGISVIVMMCYGLSKQNYSSVHNNTSV